MGIIPGNLSNFEYWEFQEFNLLIFSKDSLGPDQIGALNRYKKINMCFSAGASFTASAVLATVGVVAIKEAKQTNKLLFAAIPVLFAIQQFSEGVLWMALQQPEHESWQRPATIFFLVFAEVVWPFWVPLSIYLMEKKQPARKILAGLTIAGSLLSAFALYRIATFPVYASIDCRHIYYSYVFPSSVIMFVNAVYLLATLVSPFISTVKRTNLLGFVIIISLVISELFYVQVALSVWCFFAAIQSVVIIYILRGSRKPVLMNVY